MARSTHHQWHSFARPSSRRPGRQRSTKRQPYRRRLRIEPLEDRRLLSITVDTLTDEADGSLVDGDISLRDAIALAPAAETIDFAPALTSGGPATINLTLGELVIDKNLTIDGPGADLLTIDASGNDPTPFENNGDGSRVFNIDDGNNLVSIDIAISGLTLTGGDEQGYGGAILSRENLEVADSTIIANTAIGNGGGIFSADGAIAVTGSTISENSASGDGGGIYNADGTVTVTGSTISGNTAALSGGGIFKTGGSAPVDLTIVGSTINGNGAGLVGGGGTGFSGGGVYCTDANMTVVDSTINGNNVTAFATTTSGGGGIYIAGGDLTVTGSTISGNVAPGNGGGINAAFGIGPGSEQLRVTGSTISGNVAVGVGGGGIWVTGDDAVLSHTIVAGNMHNFGMPGDVWGSVTLVFSLLGVNTNATITDNGGNLIGPAGSPINPLLGSLANNGGTTLTHALLPSSPAIDAGDPTAAAGLGGVPEFDQRGAPFSRVYDGDGAGGARIDMGAYERQSLAGLSLVVDTLVDESDGNYNPGDLSLREAIGLANGSDGLDTITFAAALTAGGPATIYLSRGELAITDSATIDGPGADLLTIDAQHNSRVFNIDDGNLTADKTVAISGLTLTGGFASDEGGAIFSTEKLSVTGSTISGNFSDDFGGAISNVGNLTVTSSTISGNEALQVGGGIINAGNLTVTSSTISGNSAGDRGGGISNHFGNLTVTSSTISGNSAGDGGGIYSRNGNAVITNSMISGNSAFNYGGGISSDYDNLTVTSSTISGNSTNGRGGGINHDSGNLTVTRSTINGNSAYAGGGIFSNFGDLTVTHSTISGNSVVYGGGGGGIHILSYSITELSHTIVAGNTSGAAAIPNDVAGGVTLAFSLLGVDTGATITNNGGNLIGTAGSPIDPLLGPLADNGGPTLTHTLLIGSPAIDAGDPLAVAGMGGVPLFDQRGFDRVVDGDNAGGARIDIGAVEVRFLKFVVDTLVDENDGNHSAGDFSLREALSLANASVYSSDVIEFDPALAGGTILLTMGELPITDTVAIIGLGDDLLTIDAQHNSRVFNIDDGTLADKTVTIDGLTLTGGFASDLGGAIFNTENLSVTGSTISGNSAGDGGGIYNRYGNLTVTHSTISGNEALAHGGGIINAGNLTVTSSTISGNEANQRGGGIFNAGYLTVIGSTISGNSAFRDGGGIYNHGGNAVITNSMISGNTSNDSGGGIYSRGGELTVTNSTISDNSARDNRGGGIFIAGSNMTVTNSTISGNSAEADGGAIINRYSNLTVTHSTITGNSAKFDGGGISTVDGGSTELSHTIVAGNTQGVAATPNDVSGIVTLAFSLLGVDMGATITDNGGNFIGTAGSPIDPLLGPLADNGGPTKTHALLPGSPAIDAGNPAAVAGPGIVVSQNLGSSAYSASHSAPGAEPEFAFDGIVADGWNAGDYPNPVQWLEVDLQQQQALTSFRLYIDQLPDAETIHEVWVSNSAIQNDLSAATLIHTFAGFTADLDVLTFTLPYAVPAQFVQIRTTASPSWVAWDEVQVFADGVPPYDQRGVPFTRVYDGDGAGGPRIDIGAFESQPIPAAFYGDYNQNGVDDTADYTVWRNTLGQTGLTPYSGADGNGNGIIDKADYRVWKSHFGETVPGAGSVVAFAQQPPADPLLRVPAGVGAAEPIARPLRTSGEDERASQRENPPPEFVPRASLVTPHRPGIRRSVVDWVAPATYRRDEALVAWLASHADTQEPLDDVEATNIWEYEHATSPDTDSVDQVFALLAGT